MRSSQISGFYKKSPVERLSIVKDYAGLTDEEAAAIANTGGTPMAVVDRMIENVIGTFDLPLGIAVNFLINGRDYL
ncbi:MAG: 3-hydroxy-3-methylglutaryl-CoA reductase, partial [Thermoplasmata archaeon]|nr:3-hydroxy-3-methylglutaryl-CoA reductase [Thermoplasmata archaeon]